MYSTTIETKKWMMYIACTSSRTPFSAGVAFRLAALGVFVRDWSVQGQPATSGDGIT